MISPAYVQLMARYNKWQNDNLYSAADKLPDGERKRDAAAFFGSIHATLCHLLWGDLTWMHRFEPRLPAAPPLADRTAFAGLWPEWTGLRRCRASFDADIIGWADRLPAAWLDGDLTWTSSDGTRTSTASRAMLVAQFFNHQTHHRGQVHCMLTQAGVKPGDTDLPLMPN